MCQHDRRNDGYTVPSFRERDFKLKSAPEFRAVEKQLLDLLYSTPSK